MRIARQKVNRPTGRPVVARPFFSADSGTELPSPWTRPRLPQPPRPFKATIPRVRFSLQEAEQQIVAIEAAQTQFQKVRGTAANALQGKVAIVPGGTSGIGRALVVALLNALGPSGKVFVISRDLKGSLQHFSGQALATYAQAEANRAQFFWSNDGLGMDDAPYGVVKKFLDDYQMGEKVDLYANCVAFAKPGMYPGKPKIYCPDVSPQGELFEWEIDAVTAEEVAGNRKIMGETASGFVNRLRLDGYHIENEVYPSWRGADNDVSRDPASKHYGEEGAYSGALAEPKIFLRNYVATRRELAARNSQGNFGNSFLFYYPTMHTYALDQIPGATLTHAIFKFLLEGQEKSHHRFIGIPELAMLTLDFFNQKAIPIGSLGSHVQFDRNERRLEAAFRELHRKLDDKRDSAFDWRKWVTSEFLKSRGVE